MSKKKIHYSFYFVIAAFALFCSSMIGVIIYAYQFGKNYELIQDNYYQKEIVHQEVIDAKHLAENLEVKPELILFAEGMKIKFPKTARINGGLVELTRYEKASLDREFKLELNNDLEFFISKSELEGGRYLYQLSWMEEGKKYLIKKDINWNF